MCMTSSHPTSGYASPSTLPYAAEDLPLSSCQLASLQQLGVGMLPTSQSPPSMIAAPAAISAGASPIVLPTTLQPLHQRHHDHHQQQKRWQQQHQQQQRKQQSHHHHDLPLPLRKRTCKTPKERFAAFVAILLMHLNGGGVDGNKNYKLSIQAKALVAECCRRNQMGDAHFSPLQDSLSERLHGLVGDYHWNRARTYLHIYLARHHGFHASRDELEEDRRLLRHGGGSKICARAPVQSSRPT